MAKNYTITEVVKIVSEGKDITAIADIGKRFPVLLHFVTAVAAKAGDEFVEFMSFMPEYLTANKINSVIKSSISDADVEQEQPEEAEQEQPEQQEEKPAPKKRGRKAKKAEPEQEQPEDENADAEEEKPNKYAGKKAMELYSECKKRGIKVEPRKPAKYYIDLLEENDNDSAEEEDDWGEEVEEEAPAPAPKQKKTAKAKAKPAPKKEEPEDDDDNWDI